MDATEMIDSYVHDVARRLPLSKRDDVAFELRALLNDDLRARAEAEGGAPNAGLAFELLREFGRPSDVAVRYYRPFTIIEPGDTWSFLVAAVAGGALIGLLAPLARSWTSAGGPSQRADTSVLAWFGLLVVMFGVKSLILRYRPDAFEWKPRPVRDPDAVNRGALVGIALLWLALLLVYLMPGRFVELVSGGRIEAERVAYSTAFTGALRMPWLVGLLAIAIGLQLVVAVLGHWHTGTRWTRIAVTSLIGLQLGWHASYGSIMQNELADRAAIAIAAWLSALVFVACGFFVYRELTRVRPAPVSV